MTWVLVAAFGLAAWLLAVVFILGLCRAAAQADEVASLRSASGHWSALLESESNVVDLCAFRAARGAYLSSLDRRRSLSSLPSVWQVGQ
jgi:hypothetical protein